MPRPRVPHRDIQGVTSKFCYKCSSWQPINMFSYSKKTWDKLMTRCRSCSATAHKSRQLKRQQEKREKAKAKIFVWLRQNRKAIVEYAKENKHPTFEVEYAYYKAHKQKHYNNNRRKNRRETDVNFRLEERLRVRIQTALKHYQPYDTILSLVGCTIEFCKGYLECQFDVNMSWENSERWHIDHIVPCNYFDLSRPENQLRCFNYRNLQPLWSRDNLQKRNKLTEKAKNILPILNKITLEDHYSIPKEQPSEEFKDLRRKKISAGLKEFNQTVLGREIKKRSLQKRSETMKAKKDALRQSITSKTCALCKEDLPIEKFNKKSAATDGFQPYCKTCFSAYRKKLKNKL